jgi:hypothetical protein
MLRALRDPAYASSCGGRAAADRGIGLLFLSVAFAACTPTSPDDVPAIRPTAPHTSELSTPASDIRFLLRDTYEEGQRIAVRIENAGEIAYRYQPFYQACFLSYYDSRRRPARTFEMSSRRRSRDRERR